MHGFHKFFPVWSYFTVANLAKTGGIALDPSRYPLPDETLLVKVDYQRVVGGDQNIEPEVRLVPVDKERVVDVLGYNHRLLKRDLVATFTKPPLL